MKGDRHEPRAPACAKGHLIATMYTADEVRALDVLVFYCGTCEVEWKATPEEGPESHFIAPCHRRTTIRGRSSP